MNPKRMSSCLFFCISWLSIFVVDAAHSRRRPIVRSGFQDVRYDRSITTFDPSGRLLQVEYGAQAASRGSSMMGVLLFGEEKENDNKKEQEGKQIRTSPCLYLIVPSSFTAVHRIDDHIVLVATGLVGDALQVVDQMRYWCQQFCLQHGEAPTVREAAHYVAEWQHQLTRTGGQRPLGCTVLIAGVDPMTTIASNNHRMSHHPLQLFCSGPGGGLEDCRYAAIGRHHEFLMKRLAAVYPELHHQDGENCNHDKQAFVRQQLAKLWHSSHDSVNNDPHPRACNVWTLESAPTRRGQIRLRCYKDLGSAAATTEVTSDIPIKEQ